MTSLLGETSKALDHYIDSKARPDYAILIDAPWGSGKTYFIKDYYNNKDKTLLAADPLHKSKFLYASLYGAQSYKEITDQFFAQLHPLLDSKAFRVAGNAVLGFIKRQTGAALEESETHLKEALMQLGDKVLIFDDFERSNIKLIDLMGFINAYVEHDGIKTIIIANQAEIKKDQIEEYKSQKEKLVGKVLKLKPNTITAYDNFIDLLAHPTARKIAQENKSLIIEIFDSSGRQNLRSLRSILIDFDKVISSIDPIVQSRTDALKQILSNFTALGMEYYAGNLDKSEIENLWEDINYYDFSKSGLTPERSIKAQNIWLRYNKYVELSNPIISLINTASILENWNIDIDDINRALREHPNIVGNAAAPSWRVMWNWTKLDRTEYCAGRDRLLTDLQNFKFTHPGVILHCFSISSEITKLGDNFLEEYGGPTKYFKSYVDNLAQKNELDLVQYYVDHHDSQYDGLGFIGEQDDQFEEFCCFLAETISKEIFESSYQYAQHIFELLSKGDHSNLKILHESSGDQISYTQIPFLHHYTFTQMRSLFAKDLVLNRAFCAALEKRYQLDTARGQLILEYSYLYNFLIDFIQNIQNEQDPHRKYLQRFLNRFLESLSPLFLRGASQRMQQPLPNQRALES